MSRRAASLLAIIVRAALLTIALFGVIRYMTPVSKPLGEGPRVHLPADGFPESTWRQFLDSDFTIVTEVRALPSSVLQTFTEKGGSRLLMANPGQKFEVTDVILDATVPRERLIFAGVAGDRTFVHYEKGGYVHSYILEIFGPTSTGKVGPLYGGYSDAPATNFQDLRSLLIHGGCSQPIISR
jgi:hypothetical protein